MVEVDLDQWLPTVCLTFIEIDGHWTLHQLWITPLGQTDWRQIGKTTHADIAKRTVYADCTVFNDDDPEL